MPNNNLTLLVPYNLLYVEEFASENECLELCSILQEAREEKALEVHPGSGGNTLSYQRVWDMDLGILPTLNSIRERTRPLIQTLLQAEQLPFLTYTDLVYRPPGADMGWHNDTCLLYTSPSPRDS